ncbi:hypothetical protein J5M77_07295 [Bacillus amyloliquefaciens]|uniref:hypothetical protein n=1 Tax=Bacillus amyloliquefaciens group TaxID=1938374 RepID=UPI001ABE4E20|nr:MULTISPECIES: hypothetical protein [Bacillus amyloliquefaciens group]MBO3790231.1 hypothetical protein [Bacillus velezensis]MCV4329141.1 hypothetical protein [Bacillus velezensis]MEC1247098.1 hypothetical protein [Bacillus amyloliquefaciens]
MKTNQIYSADTLSGISEYGSDQNIEQQLREDVKILELVKEYTSQVEEYQKIAKEAMEKATQYGDLALEFQKSAMTQIKGSDILIHFIYKMGIEDKLLGFLNEKYNQENDADYKAAIKSLKDNYCIDEIIWDEYGLSKGIE